MPDCPEAFKKPTSKKDQALLDNFNLQSVEVFPNPANDKITLDLTKSLLPDGSSIEIYNLKGEKVSSSLLKYEQRNSIDLSSFASGTYHGLIVYKGRSYGSKKIIVSH